MNSNERIMSSPPPKNNTDNDYTRADRAILDRLGVDGLVQAYRDNGLRWPDIYAVSSTGWASHKIKGSDRSTHISTRTGYYHDKNGGESGSVWDWCARHGRFPDWRAAQQHYAGKVGVELPRSGCGTVRPHGRLQQLIDRAPPPRPTEPTDWRPLTAVALKAARHAEQTGRHESLAREMGLAAHAIRWQHVACWPKGQRLEILLGEGEDLETVFVSDGTPKDNQTMWLEWRRLNGRLEVYTINRRYDDARRGKRVLAGRERGMILSDGWDERATRAGVLHVTDGASDVAALDTLGLGGIGCPSSASAVARDHIAPEIALAIREGRLPQDIRIIVTQDLDEYGYVDPGSPTIAQWIADATGRPVWVRHMPTNPNYKGFRDRPARPTKILSRKEQRFQDAIEDTIGYMCAQLDAERAERKIRPPVYKDVREYVKAAIPDPEVIPDDADPACDWHGTDYEVYGQAFIAALWGDPSEGIYWPGGVEPPPQTDHDGYYWINGEVVPKERVIFCGENGEEPTEELKRKLLADVAVYPLSPEAVEVVRPPSQDGPPRGNRLVWSWEGGRAPMVDRRDPRNWRLRLRPDAWTWWTDAELHARYPAVVVPAAAVAALDLDGLISEIPDPPPPPPVTFDTPDVRLIRLRHLDAHSGRDCVTPRSVVFTPKDGTHLALGIDMTCNDWHCRGCLGRQRYRWALHLYHCLDGLYGHITHPTQTIYRLACDSKALRTATRKVQRCDGRYIRVATGPGTHTLYSTVDVTGSTTTTPRQAIGEILKFICEFGPADVKRDATPTAARRTYTSPFRTSDEWREAGPPKTGTLTLTAVFRDRPRAVEIMVALGAFHARVGKRDRFEFRGDAWDRERIDLAVQWAKLGEMPGGWVPGDLIPRISEYAEGLGGNQPAVEVAERGGSSPAERRRPRDYCDVGDRIGE